MRDRITSFVALHGVVQFIEIAREIYPDELSSVRLIEVANEIAKLVQDKVILVICLNTPHGQVFQGYEMPVLTRLATL